MTTGRITAEWAALPDSERRARLRALQACVRLCTGPAGNQAAELLSQAEGNPGLLPAADAALLRLSATTFRRVLSSFARTLPVFRRPKPRKVRAGEGIGQL